MQISIALLTKNSEHHLVELLPSLAPFDEVVVVDTGSSDGTVALAKTFPNVSLFEKKFTGFGPLRNFAAEVARNDWILALDSDERLSPALLQEISGLSLEAKALYLLPFHNYFQGKHIRWCGWYPESHERLYHRKETAFSPALVHERLLCKPGMRCEALSHPVVHTPYRSLSDFLGKMERYSTLFAEQYAGKRRASPLKAIGHGAWAFLRSYLLRRGILGGYEGFVISSYNGATAFYKYLKLYEKTRCSSC